MFQKNMERENDVDDDWELAYDFAGRKRRRAARYASPLPPSHGIVGTSMHATSRPFMYAPFALD